MVEAPGGGGGGPLLFLMYALRSISIHMATHRAECAHSYIYVQVNEHTDEHMILMKNPMHTSINTLDARGDLIAYMCMHMRTHVSIHICIQTCIHICIHMAMHTQIHMSARMSKLPHYWLHMPICIQKHVCKQEVI